MSRGNKYLLVAIDSFSRYPFVFPLKDITTHSLIQSVKSIFGTCGFPDAILTDQGAQFESHDFKNFLAELGIKKLRTNAYHPQGNGICERFNGTFKKLLKCYVVDKNLSFNDWVLGLNNCLLAYRTALHSATQERPVDLFFGFRVKGTIPHRRGNNKKAILNDIRSKVNQKIKLDRRKRPVKFKPNDRVLIEDQHGKKFSLKGRQAVVIKQLNSHSVLVRDSSQFTFQVAIARLSLVKEDDEEGDDEEENWVPRCNEEQAKHLLPRRPARRSSTRSESMETARSVTESESDPVPMTRRSSRHTQVPHRLSYSSLGRAS